MRINCCFIIIKQYMNQIPYANFLYGWENVNRAPFQDMGPFQVCYEGQNNFESFKKNSQWNAEEKSRYVMLIQLNKSKMENRQHKNLWQIYKHMARKIQTRNYVQCKLFHQKMMKQHKSFNEIILFLTECAEVQQKVDELRLNILKQKRAQESNKELTLQNNYKTEALYSFEFQEESACQIKLGDKKQKEDSIEECQQRFDYWSDKLRNVILPTVCI